MTASDIIAEARLFHASFTPAMHPDSVCLQAVARSVNEFVRNCSEIDEFLCADDFVVTKSQIDIGIEGNPLPIPDNIKIVSAWVYKPDCTRKVMIVSDDDHDPGVSHVIRLVGRRAYIAHPIQIQETWPEDVAAAYRAESEFNDAFSLKVTYVPRFSVNSLDSDIRLPEDARQYLVADLVIFMALRSPATVLGQQEASGLIEQAMAQKQGIMDMIARRAANETSWYL